MEDGKSQICRVGWQSGALGKSQCYSSSSKAFDWPNSFLRREISLCYIKAFNWLDRPTHIMEGNLLYSDFTNLNVNLIQKTPS
jgi:hypothetical protein